MSLWSSKKAPSGCVAQCPDCGVMLSRLADMNRHRKTKHPDGTEPKFPCPWLGCKYEATQKGNLKSHVDARHSDGPKYPCQECGRRFTDAAARIRHRKKLHGYVPYHTKEYLARKALNRKERVVQGANKAVTNASHCQQVDIGDPPNLSLSVPPPAPKLAEVAYHDDVWNMNMPVDITHSYPPLFLPYQTWPGFDTPNSIQDFPSAAQSPPPLTSSDFTIDYYKFDLHDPQLYTLQSQEQQFGESLTGDHSMPPYNGNAWNWPLQY